MNIIIRFIEVTKRFPDGTEALKNISVEIPSNKLTAIIGPSGCGKTTFMKMINRLEIPSSGEIYIDEQPIHERDVVELRRSIGYVIQRIGLIPHMTIEDNIALVPNLLGWEKGKIETRVNELLHMVDLDPHTFKKRYPLELSGGQQQRVGVSRALASDPNIILMDEPFSALDPISREQLQSELKVLQSKINKTIIFVTHDMDEALDIADNIIVMRDGQIEQMGTPSELLMHQESDFVRDFIGVERIERKRSFSEKPLLELKRFFTKHCSTEAQAVDVNIRVKDAVQLLQDGENEQLEVIHNGTTLGYINSTNLLQAAIDEKGGSK